MSDEFSNLRATIGSLSPETLSAFERRLKAGEEFSDEVRREYRQFMVGLEDLLGDPNESGEQKLRRCLRYVLDKMEDLAASRSVASDQLIRGDIVERVQKVLRS